MPSITEALFLLGAGNRVVGVTDFCREPAEALRNVARVGGTKTPRLGAIQGLEPDLVVLNTDENRRESAAELKEARISILVTETDSLQQVENTWLELGRATGNENAAARERARVADARKAARTATGRLPMLDTLVLVWKNPWIAAGSGTYMGSLLAECGFKNVLEEAPGKWVELASAEQGREGTRRPRVNLERVAPPELVLLPTEPYAFAAANEREVNMLFPSAKAVRVVDGELLGWWLSRTAAALGYFSQLRLELAGR